MGGYKPTDKAIEEPCPTPESRIVSVLKKSKYVPKMFPSDPFMAARYWMEHQEPCDDHKEAVKRSTNGRWVTPYHDRICHRLIQFLRLKSYFQAFIVDGIEQGVPWRGDPIDSYTNIIEEHKKMKKNPEKYIEDGHIKIPELHHAG